MIEQLNNIEAKYLELRSMMMDEAVYSDQQKTREVNKQLSDLEEAYQIAVAYQKAYAEREEANQILNSESDSDFLEMAQDQKDTANKRLEELEEQFKIALLPKDPNDDKNIFLEVRPAAGGDEA